jgi:hypothetical protein
MTQVLRHWRAPFVTVLTVALGLLFLPSAALGQEARESRSSIRIVSDAEFDEAHGVRSGSGTAEDPYVISGWDVSSLFIKDTNASVVITDNSVRGTMVLDWIGRDVTVTDNTVRDLRVNQNVPRTGLPTSGVISNNTFDVVGQLRHWDGEFSHNVVGQPFGTGPVETVEQELYSYRAVNFDGFNGAHFTENDIFGYVDVRIHGHHHSSGFGDDSHNHGGGADHAMMDHSNRYHEVFFHNNRITVPPGQRYALQYVDNNHAGNDRTANSEENPALNDPHIHYTRVHLTDNVLNGAGLLVNIFNANDERHIDTSRGLLEIDRNTITLARSEVMGSGGTDGITVQQARDVDVYVRDNNVTGPADTIYQQLPFVTVNATTGIDLRTVDKANIRLYDNHISNTMYGIYSSGFTESVRWFIGGLVTEDVEQPITATSSVANDWEERPAEETEEAPAEEEGTHQHG